MGVSEGDPVVYASEFAQKQHTTLHITAVCSLLDVREFDFHMRYDFLFFFSHWKNRDFLRFSFILVFSNPI